MKLEKELKRRLNYFEDNVLPTIYEWIDNRKPRLLSNLLFIGIKIISIIILILLLLVALLTRKPWFRIGLYIFFACYTKFIFEPVQIDWEQVRSRAQSWALAGAGLGILANLPYFLLQRLSNTGNLLVDITVSAVDETLSSNKNESEQKWSPWLTIWGLAISGATIGAITILFNIFRLSNVLVVIALICLDLIATAVIRKLFGKKQSTATKRKVFWLGFNDHEFRFMKNKIAGIIPVSWKEMNDGRRFEVYRSNTKAIALEFLNNISNTEIPKLFYIIVETPQGNIGKDMQGIFDEPYND